MKIINIVGARPNFMKIAPIIEEMKKHKEITSLLVHTEQHYDERMSKLFFEELSLPRPDICLGVGSASHAAQTAKVMVEFEKVLLEQKPDLVLVVGDVNSTLACALTAVKLNIKVAHVEAGLRSFDRTMPEEINRIVTDALSEYLFITEKGASENLLKEGMEKEKIYFVGNVMIDTLLKNKQRADNSLILNKLHLIPRGYALLTLHRPSNVDDKDNLFHIIEALEKISEFLPIVFPVHPRTQQKIKIFELEKNFSFLNDEGRLMLIEPQGYIDFLKLMSEAKVVLTDSGGIQEETTVLGVPCVTIRENTERPVTVIEGTNVLAGTKKDKIIEETRKIVENNKYLKKKIPEKWDGLAAKRIVQILLSQYNVNRAIT